MGTSTRGAPSGPVDSQKSAVYFAAGTLTSLTTKVITQTLSGARVTDFVEVAPLAALPTGVTVGKAYVSAAGVISIRFANVTTADVAGGNVSLAVLIHKFST
jgi:hypothetical protein